MRAKALSKVIKRKSPLICLIAAGVGFAITAKFVADAAVEAHEKIDDEWDKLSAEEKEEIDDFTFVEKTKITWKCWLKPAISGGLTVAVAIAGYRLHDKQLKAAVALYSSAESALVAYQSQVLETVGKKKAEEIAGKVAEKKMAEDPETDGNRQGPIIIDDKHVKFYDSMSGRYFYSTYEHVKAAMNEFNDLLNDEPGLVNELYSCLGLSGTDLGGWSGWTKPDAKWRLDWRFEYIGDENKYPCVMITPDLPAEPITRLY